MFLKPFRIKSNSAIKGTDRKKLRQFVLGQFPECTEEMARNIVPSKETMTVSKLLTHHGDIVLYYSVSSSPILFQVEEMLFPTLYLLWDYPNLIPSVSTYPVVEKKILAGAALMLPGVKVEEQQDLFGLPDLRKGSICAARVIGNRAAMAVGTVACSTQEMIESKMQGKGVVPLHVFSDFLYNAGSKILVPIISYEQLTNKERELNECKESTLMEEQASNVANTLNELQLKENVDNNDNDVGRMDELLIHCCMCVIKLKVKKSDLPILINKFYKQFMTSFCQEGQVLDVKRSSFKKLSKFMIAMEDRGFLDIKEISPGVDAVVAVYKYHHDFKSFEVSNLLEPEQVSTDKETLTIKSLLLVNDALLKILDPVNCRKTGDSLSMDELHKELVKYVDANSLQMPDNQIRMDIFLSRAFQENSDSLSWKEISERCYKVLKPAYSIQRGSAIPQIYCGLLKPIHLKVSLKSNKKTTTVENFEIFGICADDFTEKLHNVLACSVTAKSHKVSPKITHRHVIVQGDQVKTIKKLLTDVYNVPLIHLCYTPLPGKTSLQKKDKK